MFVSTLITFRWSFPSGEDGETVEEGNPGGIDALMKELDAHTPKLVASSSYFWTSSSSKLSSHLFYNFLSSFQCQKRWRGDAGRRFRQIGKQWGRWKVRIYFFCVSLPGHHGHQHYHHHRCNHNHCAQPGWREDARAAQCLPRRTQRGTAWCKRTSWWWWNIWQLPLRLASEIFWRTFTKQITIRFQDFLVKEYKSRSL